MSNLATLSPTRQAAVAHAAAGCWPGTNELIGALVQESRHKGAWKPHRAALINALASVGEVHMTAEQFGVWKKQARALGKINGTKQRAVEDLGMNERRFSELSSAARQKVKGIAVSRIEALACAHYLMNLPKPCEPEGLRDWFWPRFGAYASVAAFFDLKPEAFASYINGYVIEDGVKHEVVPTGAFLRALDWVWRFGPTNPYGTRKAVQFWPDQEAIQP